MKTPNCLICHEPMKLKKTLESKQKITKFTCENGCEYECVIHGGGYFDLVVLPEWAVKKKVYSEETGNLK